MSLIEIRPPQSVDEYREACAMVEKVYREAGYLGQSGTQSYPKGMLLATRGDRIIGTMGVMSGDQAQLPTEEAFDFEASQIVGCERSQIFEALRLVVIERSDPAAIQGLIAGAMLYSHRRSNCQAWIMTITPILARALARYCHLKTGRLENQTPAPHIVAQHRGYWTATPPPVGIWVSRTNTEIALSQLKAEMVERVRIDLDSFDHYRHHGQEATYQRPLVLTNR